MKDLKNACEMYIKYCKFERGLSINSVQAYSYDLEGLCLYAAEKFDARDGAVEIEKLDRDFWQEYIGVLSDTLRVTTVRRRMVCYKGFFNFLTEEGIIAENPFEKLRIRLKVPDTAPETLALEEVQQVLDAAYSYEPHESVGITKEMAQFIHYRDIAVLEILFATGMRVHELCDMTFSTYNRKSQTIRVVGKGCKERFLYIGNVDVISAINTYLEYRASFKFKNEHLFLNRWGDPLSCQAVREIVTKYCVMAGIGRNITPHAFRHTFASLLLEEGVEIRYIQEFLGHSSISTTQIYLHTSERKKREILTKMHPRKKLHSND